MRVIIQNGPYRIIELHDDHCDLENLKGQCFDPKVNPDIDPEILKQEEKDFEDLVSREGVYGYALEQWDPEVDGGWQPVDSCWGFVGQYAKHEERFNHYIVDELLNQIPKIFRAKE